MMQVPFFSSVTCPTFSLLSLSVGYASLRSSLSLSLVRPERYFVRPPIHPSDRPFHGRISIVGMSILLSFRPPFSRSPAGWSVRPSVCLYVWPASPLLNLSARLSVHLSVRRSVRLTVHPSVSISNYFRPCVQSLARRIVSMTASNCSSSCSSIQSTSILPSTRSPDFVPRTRVNKETLCRRIFRPSCYFHCWVVIILYGVKPV